MPFIARYRKEQTGNLDEVAIQSVLDAKETWDAVEHRKKFICEEIEKQGKLTPELKEKILATYELERLEDLYLPYKQKRKTQGHDRARSRARAARRMDVARLARGGADDGPLAEEAARVRRAGQERRDGRAGDRRARATSSSSGSPRTRICASTCVAPSSTKGSYARRRARRPSRTASSSGTSRTTSASTLSCAPRRRTGTSPCAADSWRRSSALSLGGAPGDESFEAALLAAFERAACPWPSSPAVDAMNRAARLALRVYVWPSIENEAKKALRDVADAAAIHVFAENLRKLLLASPYGAKSVLGVDPGIRTGCKLAVVSESGAYLGSHVIFLGSDRERESAKQVLRLAVESANVSAVAVGNGTAGRETEAFVRGALGELGLGRIPVVMVSEAGASVYSASEVAREEFPDLGPHASAAPSRSPGACRIRSRSSSRWTRRASASGSTSTT